MPEKLPPNWDQTTRSWFVDKTRPMLNKPSRISEIVRIYRKYGLLKSGLPFGWEKSGEPLYKYERDFSGSDKT
jgi:hypothetical protein